MTNIIETLKLKLASGNDVPVSRISLTREEAEAILNRLYSIEFAKDIAFQYAGIDGAHHKMWLIDQMLRYLMTTQEYEEWVATWQSGEDGPETYKWDEGVAP